MSVFQIGERVQWEGRITIISNIRPGSASRASVQEDAYFLQDFPGMTFAASQLIRVPEDFGGFMVAVEGASAPSVVHSTFEKACEEAERLGMSNSPRRVFVLELKAIVSVKKEVISNKTTINFK